MDRKNSAIHILDEEYRRIRTITKLTGIPSDGKTTLREPESVFVRQEDGRTLLYIAETGNQRIICTNDTGWIVRELPEPSIKFSGKAVDYKPSKLTVDSARIYVAANAVNRGLEEFSHTGKWSGFIGAPEVTVDFAE